MSRKTTAPSKRKARSKKTKARSSSAEAWPQKRKVLFRPDRWKYVRKMERPEGCVFCRSATEKMSLETLCVHRTSYSQVVLNKYPYNSGHVLVLPLRHCGNLLELSAEESADLWAVLRKTMTVLTEVYQPGGINVGLNHGAAAGAGLPEHLHFHLIPRWAGDLNFFPLVAETKVVVEGLDDSYRKILSGFQAGKDEA